MDATITNTAHQWLALGYQPLPLRADLPKVPAVPWQEYQKRHLTGSEIDTLFDRDTDGLGIITGTISGNLEMLELEGRAVKEAYLVKLGDALRNHNAENLWLKLGAGYVEQTPSGGMHFYYRTDGPALPNTKLASRPATDPELDAWKVAETDKARLITDPALQTKRLERIHATQPEQLPQVLIETRGEGGFTVIAPSHGRSHPSGNPWEILTGTPEKIPTLTTQERDLLHACAKTLNQIPATPTIQQPATPTPTQPRADGQRPGDDYNTKTMWDELLIPDGWTKTSTHPNGETEWTRPGKNPHEGPSATTGRRQGNEDCLYVFTTSTDLPDNTPISKFHYYTLTRHAGNHADATRTLAKLGYGTPLPVETPRLTLIQGSNNAPTQPNLALQPNPTSTSPNPTGASPNPTSLTDTGNAQLFIDQHHDQLHYAPFLKQWLAWDGTRWHKQDDTGQPMQAATATIRAIQPGNNETRDWQKRSLSRRNLENTVILAATHPQMRVNANQLDANPHQLNTPGGIVNLRDGSIQPTKPADWVTKTTHCAPDPAMPTPLWSQFLADTFNNNPQLIQYVQRLAGYSATGEVTHHILPFLHGAGNNGKSVLLDTLQKLLGDYATSAPKGFLMAGRDDPSAIARLHGIRLVIASEVNQNQAWDEALIKQLTGGDTLTARHLYSNYFTFTPSHKIWIAANHQPRVNAGGDSFWRRLRLIPFTNQVPEHARIENLTQRLVNEEGPGILAWIIKGAVAQQRGLNDPQLVLAATQEYAAEEDHLGRFVADKCKLGGGAESRTKKTDLRRVYSQWCRENSEPELSGQNLGRELRVRFGVDSTDKGRRYYDNVMLWADDEDAPPRGWETGL